MVSPDPEVSPIVLALELEASPEDCYRSFVSGFGDWWPTHTHSLSRDPQTRCALQARPGGRVFETFPDGTEHVWGEVITARTGEVLRFTWHPGREAASAQWVEVDFEATSSGTRVTLTHGGWEALGEIAPILRREYVPGWSHVLGECFGSFARRRH